jgi:hypothetical protein
MEWLLRYGNPFDQLEAEADFVERRGKCDAYLKSLTDQLSKGNLNAFRELLYLAYQLTGAANRFAQAEPDLAGVFAENYSSWPILWTGANLSRDHQQWLRRLRLGAAKPDVAGPGSIGQYPPLTRKWAILLLNLIESIRRLQGVRSSHKSSFWIPRRIVMEFQVPTEDVFKARENDLGFSVQEQIKVTDLFTKEKDAFARDPLARAAKKLPPFQYGVGEKWWRVAEELFDRITASGSKNFPGLSTLARTQKVETLKESRGTHHSELKKYIKPVFLTLFRQ